MSISLSCHLDNSLARLDALRQHALPDVKTLEHTEADCKSNECRRVHMLT